jgi:hypothetical protein
MTKTMIADGVLIKRYLEGKDSRAKMSFNE